MSGADAEALPPTGPGEGGAVLGEEARAALRELVTEHKPYTDTPEGPCCAEPAVCHGHDPETDCEQCGSEWPCPTFVVMYELARVAALVAQARADGAAEERERIKVVMEQTWADPMGRWNAGQAEAAAQQKAEMFRRVTRRSS